MATDKRADTLFAIYSLALFAREEKATLFDHFAEAIL
jgi:hypothetical protein